MIAEYTVNLKNKTKDELIMLVKEGLEVIQKQQTEITALQMEHDHDVKMIDEVKGEAVRLYKEIERLKGNKIYTVEEMDRIEKEDMGYDR